MAAAGAILVEVHELLASMIRPGVTTKELDAAAEELIRSRRAKPTFKGYKGFPATLCTSPNAMVVHGIPGPYAAARGRRDLHRLRRDQERLGRRRGSHPPRGRGRPGRHGKLLEVTEASLHDAVEQCRVGNRLGDVSHAVQAPGRGRRPVGRAARWWATAWGARCTRTPRSPTTAPRARVRCWPRAWSSPWSRWSPPAGTRCAWATTTGPSTPRTARLSAHFEFTVAITVDGPRILTPWHERLRVAA